jgi:dTDP-4-amino-4,6-dideoxy-D-galactose acyltransferase
MSSIHALDWDSLIFGYPVGRLDLFSTITKDGLDEVLHASEFRLTCIFSTHPIIGIEPVDVKLTYGFDLSQPSGVSPIHQVDSLSSELTEQVRLLAHASGEFSRFRTDPNFTNNEFDLLYNLWIANSVSRRIAEEVLVTRVGTLESGLISLERVDNDSLRIGLASVHPKYRGLGFAKSLIAHSILYALKNSYKRFTVVTQKANLPARSLYEKTGFKLLDELYVYHHWK